MCGVRAAVVILNYNGEEHLRRFLPSVVEHTPEWVDIIVADNGSTDLSCGVIEELFTPRVTLLRLGHNYGFAEGYNRALESLEYDIFTLLNSDVEATAGYLEPLYEELMSSPDIAVVGSKLRSYTERDKFEYAGAAGGYIDILGYPFCRGRVMGSIEVDRGQYDDARDLFWVSGAAFTCRGEVYKRLGGFNGDLFAHMEEIDLCWRVQLAGYRVRIVPQSVIYHLGGGTLNIDSPFKTKLNHRNNLAMIYRCAPTSQRILVAVTRPFLDLLASLSYLLKGRADSAKAVFTAWGEFLAWHKRLDVQREAIRTSRVAESLYIYRGSIILKHLWSKIAQR